MFDAVDLELMQQTQQSHLMDTCHIQACVQSANSFGELVETWPTDGPEIDCGLDVSQNRKSSERHGQAMTVVEYDAILRLPVGTSVDEKDRIKITKRYGAALDAAWVFDVVGPPQQGPSGIILQLRRTEV